MTPASTGEEEVLGKVLETCWRQEASPGCLCLAGSGVRAVAAASTQPKGHLAPCPCSPHRWAHLPTDLKPRGGEKYSLFLESVGAWPGAGGLDAFSGWWLKWALITTDLSLSFALILTSCVALGWSLPSLNLSFFLCKVGIEIPNVREVLRVQRDPLAHGKVLASKG